MRLALALLLASPAAAQTNEGTQIAQAPVQAGDYAYQLFVPRGYAAMPRQQWPLVIFLHGSGERGSDIERVKVNGPPRIIARHPGSPFLMISPQLEEGGEQVGAGGGPGPAAMTATRQAGQVDTRRVDPIVFPDTREQAFELALVPVAALLKLRRDHQEGGAGVAGDDLRRAVDLHAFDVRPPARPIRGGR